MKQLALRVLILSFLFSLNFDFASAASAKRSDFFNLNLQEKTVESVAGKTGHLSKTTGRHDKKLEKKKTKLQKWLKKRSAKPYGNAKNYLILCLGLFVISIVFLAIGGVIFNIFGTVTALAAAIFFVLWLLDFTGTM